MTPTALLSLSTNFLLTASLLLAASVKGSELAKPGEKPNVIVIYVDDVGWVDLESYGSEFYETPKIDSLLSKGLRFTQAYSNAPLLLPLAHRFAHRAPLRARQVL